MNIETKIKKQHYVSKFYLKNWCKDKKQLKVMIKNHNKCFYPTNLDSIAQKRFFYKVEITQNVFDLLLSRYYNNNICKKILQEMQILLEIDRYKKEKKESFKNLDIININILEEKYSKIEPLISPVINKIENDIIQYINDLILNKENIHTLVDFYFLQFYRTKKMRKSLSEIMHELYVTKNNIRNKLSDEEKENFITVMQFIDPIIEVEKFYKKNFSIELIINFSKLNFHTSDAPAFATTNKKKNISELEGFMPLTPKVGMIIRGYQLHEKKVIIKKVYNKKVIAKYNKVIDGNADYHIYCTI